MGTHSTGWIKLVLTAFNTVDRPVLIKERLALKPGSATQTHKTFIVPLLTQGNHHLTCDIQVTLGALFGHFCSRLLVKEEKSKTAKVTLIR